MNSKIRWIIVGAVGITMLASVGCCRRPPEEVAQAEAAVAQAKEKCAEVYAPEEYKKAYDTLSMAQKYGADRKCKEAKSSALEAIQLAGEAEKRAAAKEAELEAEVTRLVGEAEKVIEGAKATWANLEKRKAEVDAERQKALEALVPKEQEAEAKAEFDLPEVTLDTAPKGMIAKAEEQLAKAKALHGEGGCNLFQVIDELKKVPGMLDGYDKMIADMLGKLDALSAEIKKQLELNMARLEKIISEKDKTHVVVKGECLWKIAEKDAYINDPFKWPLIWWVNQWTEEKVAGMSEEDRFNLVKDPDLIFPDQKLTIRHLSKFTQEKINEAIHYAKNRYGLEGWQSLPEYFTDGK